MLTRNEMLIQYKQYLAIKDTPDFPNTHALITAHPLLLVLLTILCVLIVADAYFIKDIHSEVLFILQGFISTPSYATIWLTK